ncbi:MAG: tetratricopeptide repeat protein, partial [Planctomycetota bacterium]
DLLRRIHETLGRTSRRLGELASEEESLRAAAALAPEGDERARALYDLAEVRAKAKDFGEARALYEEVVAIIRGSPDRPGKDVGLANMLSVLGQFLKTAGAFGAAEAALTESVALFERTRGRESAEVYGPRNGLASLRYRQGRFEEALAIYDDLAGPARALAESNPLVPQNVRNNRALVLGSMGRLEEAAVGFEEVLARKRERVGGADPTVGHTLHDYAQVLLRSGDLEQAEGRAREARAIFAASAAPGREEFLGSLGLLLGEVALSRGRLEEAERELRDAIEAHGRWLPEDGFPIAEARTALAECLLRGGRLPEAEALARESLPVLERTFGVEDPRTRR